MGHIRPKQCAENQRINTSLARAVIIATALLAEACASIEPRAASTPTSAPQATHTAPTVASTATPASTTAASPTAEPPPIRIESVIGADDITLVVTTPISRGQMARATVTTLPHAFCSITVNYASVLSTADGLAAKDADGSGFASWSWTVEPSVPPGSWPVEVTCLTVSGLRAVARQMLVVV